MSYLIRIDQPMKKTYTLLAFIVAVLLLGACKQEKKVTYYEGIYSEKPVSIFIAPVDDQTMRKVEKYPSDIEYNDACNTATQYFQQTLAYPFIQNGYYVVGPVSARQIMEAEEFTFKHLRRGSLKDFYNAYGIDAVLNTTLYRWQEKNAEWTLFIEYQLRSTKTNTELMHKWVKATKRLPTNLKGDAYIMKEDKAFAASMGGLGTQATQQCYLVEKCNDYVLRNLPTSSTRRQFEEDLYHMANATYISYIWTEEGRADVQQLSPEEFEQACFVDK